MIVNGNKYEPIHYKRSELVTELKTYLDESIQKLKDTGNEDLIEMANLNGVYRNKPIDKTVDEVMKYCEYYDNYYPDVDIYYSYFQLAKYPLISF